MDDLEGRKIGLRQKLQSKSYNESQNADSKNQERAKTQKAEMMQDMCICPLLRQTTDSG